MDSGESSYLTAQATSYPSNSSHVSHSRESIISSRIIRDQPVPELLRRSVPIAAVSQHAASIFPVASQAEAIPPLQDSVHAFRRSQRPPHPVRRRTQPSESVSFSISSEDPDGIRVAHDARPDLPLNTRTDTRARSRWTQSTMGISTHYPQSSDMTATESSSVPSTPTESVRENAIFHQPEPETAVDRPYYLDPNDVSYRLRLLVKNNYYLPPAHSKPRHVGRTLEPNPVSTVKQSPTGLRDIFRVGASKARSPRQSPSSPLSSSRPALGARRPQSDNAPSPTLLLPPAPRRAVSADVGAENDRRGRVVVIRERLDDEDDSSAEAVSSRGHGLQASTVAPPADVIDPTDVVDLPSYAFEPQASIGNVLGSTSLGASALAEFAPSSLGHRTMSPQDEAWRRALLMEAVDLSMSSIPDLDHSSQSVSAPRSAPSATSAPPIPPIPPIPRASVRRSSSKSTTRSSRSRPVSPVQDLGSAEAPTTLNEWGPPAMPSSSAAASHALMPPPRRKKSNLKAPFQEPVGSMSLDDGRETPWQTIKKTLTTPLLSERLSGDPNENIPPIIATRTEDSLSSDSNYSDEDNMLGINQRISKDASTFISDRRSFSASYRSHMSSAFGPQESQLPEAGPSRPLSAISALALRRSHAPQPLALDPDHAPRQEPSDDGLTPTMRLSPYTPSRPRSRTVSDLHPPTPRSPARAPPTFANASSVSLELPSHGPPSHLFDSFDPTKPLTNTPSPSSRYFTPRSGAASRRSPRIPESTFELLKHGLNESDHSLSSEGLGVGSTSADQPRADGGLGDLVKLHIEAEKDHIRRIASSMRY